jgi:hypothetical protein
MKFVFIILVLLSIQIEAKTVMVGPPDGYTFFGLFKPETALEKKAYIATLAFLRTKGDEAYDYYLEKSGLNIKSGLFEFKLKHRSTFRNNKTVMDQSYKNGVVYYDVTANKVVKFVRSKTT